MTKVEVEGKLLEHQKAMGEDILTDNIIQEEDKYRKVWKEMMIREETYWK